MSGNIARIEWFHKLHGSRIGRHGGIHIYFIFQPGSRIAAEYDIDALMENHGLVRNKDYTVPSWNFNFHGSFVKSPVAVVFKNPETYVMAKMSWDIEHDELQ